MLKTDLTDSCYDFSYLAEIRLHDLQITSPDIQLDLMFHLVLYLGRATLATGLNSTQRNMGGFDLCYLEDWSLENLPHDTPGSLSTFICCTNEEYSDAFQGSYEMLEFQS